MLLKILTLLSLSLPVTYILIHWPLVFAVVGGGGCVLALCVMAVQIVTSAPRYEPENRRASATVEGVPVKEVTVLP